MQTLRIIFVTFSTVYFCGFFSVVFYTYTNRWEMVKAECKDRDDISRWRFMLISHSIVVLISFVWPWLMWLALCNLKVSIREWYAKRKTRKIT